MLDFRIQEFARKGVESQSTLGAHISGKLRETVEEIGRDGPDHEVNLFAIIHFPTSGEASLYRVEMYRPPWYRMIASVGASKCWMR